MLVALALAACGADRESASKTPRETPTSTAVIASGSSAQLGAMNAWRTFFREIAPDAVITYRPVGSGSGVREFIQGMTAFAGSDVVMTSQQHAQADRRCGSPALHLPMVVGPIAVIYNLEIADLKLSPATITGIFSGKITKWNDRAIAADNPRTSLPRADILAIHRADESGTSENLTKYLKAAGGWPYPPSTKWPISGGQGVEGSAAMTEAVRTTAGAIGYVEYGYASGHELWTARVKNATGESVPITPDSASKALVGAKIVGRNGDLALKLDYTTTRPGTYPIILVTYEIACSKGSPPLVRRFLRYAASNAGQTNLTPLGYAPLPPDLLVKVRTSIEAMS